MIKSRWENLPLRTKVFAVLVVPILPLFVFAAFVVSTALRERDTEAAVLHALAVKAHLRDMVSQSAEAEASTLAFLLTREASALQPFLAVAWAEGAVNGGATFYISLPIPAEGTTT